MFSTPLSGSVALIPYYKYLSQQFLLLMSFYFLLLCPNISYYTCRNNYASPHQVEVYEMWCVRNCSIRDMVYTRLKYTIYGVSEIWVYEIGFTVIGRYTELKVYEMSRHQEILLNFLRPSCRIPGKNIVDKILRSNWLAIFTHEWIKLNSTVLIVDTLLVVDGGVWFGIFNFKVEIGIPFIDISGKKGL